MDDGILGGLKDILFGTTGPRGGKKDGVVQTMAKSAARQVTNQIVRGMLGSLLGGEEGKPGAICLCLMRRWRALSCQHHCNILNFHDFSDMNEAHFANNNKGSFRSLYSFIRLRFSH